MVVGDNLRSECDSRNSVAGSLMNGSEYREKR